MAEYIYIIGDDCNVGVTIWTKGGNLPVIGMKKNFLSSNTFFQVGEKKYTNNTSILHLFLYLCTVLYKNRNRENTQTV